MEYTKTYNDLKSVFNAEAPVISLPDSGIKIHNLEFRSDPPSQDFSNLDDLYITENRSFSYPVFSPANKNTGKVILLLHGLNERSWIKYLVWAYYLAESTGSYVILFPIAFHINRSPASWKDPRAMIPFLKTRNSGEDQIEMSSFANIALSNRLTEDPTRFFRSGYETTSDIINLITEVRNGKHAIIPKAEQVNIFAYSIGAFLAEIIMMGNPANLFTDSKLFILCGGAVFSNMRGTSKLIMDSLAFSKVYNYYMNDFEGTLTGRSQLVEYLRTSQIGMAFRAMIDTGRLKSFREHILRSMKDQIHAIALLKDSVIPPAGIISTLKSTGKDSSVDIWDFPFAYSHENPFPVFNNVLSEKVDFWFNRVFSEAGLYLA